MGRKIINDIVKVYPNHMKLVIYHRGYELKVRTGKTKDPEEAQISSAAKKEENLHRSLRRTKEVFKDIVISNRFDYFMTFTFDQTKHNRFDVDHCKSVMSKWLDNQRRRTSPNLVYLIVPEFHKKCEDCTNATEKTAHLSGVERLQALHSLGANKDGTCPHDDAPKAIHFHALVSNFNGRLNPVINKKTGQQLKSKSGGLLFDIPGYRAGRIRQAIKLTDNYDAIAGYMMKQYLTKDMPMIHGRRRYWASRNLKRPEKIVNGIFKLGLSKIIKRHKPLFINDYLEVQLHEGIQFANIKHTGQQISFNAQIMPMQPPPYSHANTKYPRKKMREYAFARIPAHSPF